jgi:hypothetical protein
MRALTRCRKSAFVALACAVSVAGCGHQVISEEAPGGRAGGAVSIGGSGGSGGRAGSSSKGGTWSLGGTSSLGGSVSDAGAPTAGRVGDAPECQLPLVSGTCRTGVPRYGYNQAAGHCQKFVYSGCGANANNFESLEECEGRCGGSAVSDCPERAPAMTECPRVVACQYSIYNCLCAWYEDNGDCEQIDPNCKFSPIETAASDVPETECTGPDCPSPIVFRPPTPYTCSCSEGIWWCSW